MAAGQVSLQVLSQYAHLEPICTKEISINIKGTWGGKSRRPEVVAVILNVKAYDNKTALAKSILKTAMDPSGGLKGSTSIWTQYMDPNFQIHCHALLD